MLNWQNIYTRKDIVMMETYIDYFQTSFYIPAIQKLEFHLLHVQILGTHRCKNTGSETFTHHRLFQYLLCCCDYAERVVASFAHHTQYKLYGGNLYVSIEGIALEQFSAITHLEMELIPKSHTRHAMFNSFFLIITNNMIPQLPHTENA